MALAKWQNFSRRIWKWKSFYETEGVRTKILRPKPLIQSCRTLEKPAILLALSSQKPIDLLALSSHHEKCEPSKRQIFRIKIQDELKNEMWVIEPPNVRIKIQDEVRHSAPESIREHFLRKISCSKATPCPKVAQRHKRSDLGYDEPTCCDHARAQSKSEVIYF